jgi:hypothetical protein
LPTTHIERKVARIKEKERVLAENKAKLEAERLEQRQAEELRKK